eukprot:gnl/TRDRNA2_/TRDRNA2_166648_c0_seq1.p1 gnl/TRDRNA2_/TRDRNA2_166648_c0~~gnl/TRDRNA2_/TRDRNA2_166648_c0_seq1.p1  ORF type:complete len:801 (-),score=144.13 gnl/TRDRNA2_/TRDRNA2_166648_c0_seq1:54-2456(-)
MSPGLLANSTTPHVSAANTPRTHTATGPAMPWNSTGQRGTVREFHPDVAQQVESHSIHMRGSDKKEHVDHSSGSGHTGPYSHLLTNEYATNDTTERERQVETIKVFLEEREGSSLRAWMKHFDMNNDAKISLSEFTRGLRKMNFTGDATVIFNILDRDRSGEISLDEIHVAQAKLWRRFCHWCVQTFQGPREMLLSLCGSTEGGVLCKTMFIDAIIKRGWNEGWEEIIFESLDIDGAGSLSMQSLKWLEVEKRRQRRKQLAKIRSAHENAKRAQERKAANELLADFKAFLRKRYGHYVRAWRRALSMEDSMVLTKHDLFKAVVEIGWVGDVRLLWKAFDKDDSGYVTIEELDAKSAEALAHFRIFIGKHFGSASASFRALDKYNAKSLRYQEFTAACRAHGFNKANKSLFFSIDWAGNKRIVEEDLLFLDRWSPPMFLVANPSPEAAEEVKLLLLKTHKNFLKAWRHCLDTDSSNRVNWEEFESACKRIHYYGDTAGAWRHLDSDLSGFISLHELDPAASDTLLGFKNWADAEFGSVRSAFNVFDTDGSNEVSYREFRRACRSYGFERDVHALFHALDHEKNGNLSMDEVAFLDDWEQTVMDDNSVGDDKEGPRSSIKSPGSLVKARTGLISVCQTTEYCSEGPGPANYVLPSTIGAGPRTPMLNFSGAYSFRKRTGGEKLHPLKKDSSPSPASYNDREARAAVTTAKPSWSFGSETRKAIERPVVSTTPGPGHYCGEVNARHQLHRQGPATMMSPRRPLKVHPLFRQPFADTPRVQTAGPTVWRSPRVQPQTAPTLAEA